MPIWIGSYAVTVKYGQILFFAALSVSTVFIPHLSRARGNGGHFRNLAIRLMGLLTIANIVAFLTSVTFLPDTVAPVFGNSYVQAGALLPSVILAYGLLAFCFCLVNIMVVLEQKTYLFILFFSSIVVVISLNIYHRTLHEVLLVMTIIYGMLFISLLVLIARKFKEMSYVTHS